MLLLLHPLLRQLFVMEGPSSWGQLCCSGRSSHTGHSHIRVAFSNHVHAECFLIQHPHTFTGQGVDSRVSRLQCCDAMPQGQMVCKEARSVSNENITGRDPVFGRVCRIEQYLKVCKVSNAETRWTAAILMFPIKYRLVIIGSLAHCPSKSSRGLRALLYRHSDIHWPASLIERSLTRLNFVHIFKRKHHTILLSSPVFTSQPCTSRSICCISISPRPSLI